MAVFQREDVSLHYETHGDGFPVLLLAPGGMRSTINAWPSETFNPIEALAPHFRVIALDQRNAGQSWAPISGGTSWQSYTEDQLALLDYLEVQACHLVGMCIGGSYSMGLIQSDPGRIASAVLFQPIGHDGTNRTRFHDMFDSWASDIKSDHPEANDSDWQSFLSNMYSGDFLFNVSEDMVKNCKTQLLVLLGQDDYHPEEISRRVVNLAQNGQLIEQWKGEHSQVAGEQVLKFLLQNTPS